MARTSSTGGSRRSVLLLGSLLALLSFAVGVAVFLALASAEQVSYLAKPLPPAPPRLDRREYDQRMMRLAHRSTTTASTTVSAWPVQAPYPLVGAILPFKRVIAYYGNFLSRGMGVLGEYPEDVVIQKLSGELARWNAADPTTPTVPAIEYIAVTAQEAAGRDGMYRARMSDAQIDRALALARKVDGIVILDIQVGLSTLEQEIPELSKYLALPQVHLAIDPEFAMKKGSRPGTVIGGFDADDVNYAVQYLADLVRTHNLPPKILVVHRFTTEMVRNSDRITPLPEVQIVMHMDGWGNPDLKKGTYQHVITEEPVQFAGLKIFYKNDMKPPSTRLLTPEEALELMPAPIFIQYQ